MEPRVVVDNSVVMAWCFDDESDEYADGLLGQLEHFGALAPAVWVLELTNVLLVAERTKRLTEAAGANFLELLSSLPIDVARDDGLAAAGRILSLARETHLSSYDAAYLDLAMRMGLPLATRDKALRQAAKKLSVEIWQN